MKNDIWKMLSVRVPPAPATWPWIWNDRISQAFDIVAPSLRTDLSRCSLKETTHENFN